MTLARKTQRTKTKRVIGLRETKKRKLVYDFYKEAEQGVRLVLSGVQGHFRISRMHYDKDTRSILIDESTVPDVNSHTMHSSLLVKPLKKKLKAYIADMDERIECKEYMNIGFLVQNDPHFEMGSVHEWTLFDEQKYIDIIDKHKQYQKGLYFWVYTTGILNDRDDN